MNLKYIGLGISGSAFAIVLFEMASGGSQRPLTQEVFAFGVLAICGAVLSLWR